MTTLVRDVMTRAPLTIDPQAPVATAAAVMRERGFRHLPVVEDDGRLVGMISDRDIRSACLAAAVAEYLPEEARRRRQALEALEETCVRHVMTWHVVTTHPQASVAQAAAEMLLAEVGSLAVVEHGRLVGIVTERDVLKA
ncbi:MAG TPA: CBS domain-containing protein, partial [Methylomirabilota bacterium]|nr:CBS domain-containing protein [Methylomirabilota bacterium]